MKITIDEMIRLLVVGTVVTVVVICSNHSMENTYFVDDKRKVPRP